MKVLALGKVPVLLERGSVLSEAVTFIMYFGWETLWAVRFI